eukprot:12540833-Heterocapsa_arctica.AAC.1
MIGRRGDVRILSYKGGAGFGPVGQQGLLPASWLGRKADRPGSLAAPPLYGTPAQKVALLNLVSYPGHAERLQFGYLEFLAQGNLRQTNSSKEPYLSGLQLRYLASAEEDRVFRQVMTTLLLPSDVGALVVDDSTKRGAEREALGHCEQGGRG